LRSETKPRPRLALAVVLCVFLSTLGMAFASSAMANSYGHYDLHDPCCSGQNLYGTRASIRQDTNSLPSGHFECQLYRSDAETTNALIQAGVVRCGSGSPGLDGTCSLSNNLVRFVEQLLSSGYTCYPKGGTSFGTDARFTVQRTASSTWYAFIAGVKDTHAYTRMNEAVYLIEGGEMTGPCTSAGSSSSRYGVSTAWQRYNGSSWVTVGSSYNNLDCGWSLSGGPTGAWTASRS
jgi:hypothetical protein